MKNFIITDNYEWKTLLSYILDEEKFLLLYTHVQWYSNCHFSVFPNKEDFLQPGYNKRNLKLRWLMNH